MLKVWIAPLLGLFASILFIFANAAPAKATRSLVQSTGALQSVRMTVPRDLSDVIDRGITGLKFEDPILRAKTLSQARIYLKARKHGSSKDISKFVAQCLSERAENPFCMYEVQTLSDDDSTKPFDETRLRPSIFSISTDLQDGDLKKLATYSSAELARGVNQYSDFQPLIGLIEKVIASSDCTAGDLAWALAGKAEENFPEAKFVDYSSKLHRKAAACANDMNSSKSRFRFALISIWQNKCAEAEPELKKLADVADTHFSARAKYWRYHCANVTKNETLKKEMRDQLWSMHLLTFHNLAVNGNDSRFEKMLADAPKPMVSFRTLMRPDLNNQIRAVETLVDLGESRFAAAYADKLVAKLTSTEPEVRLYMAALMHRAGETIPKFKILSSLFQNFHRMISRETLGLLFPKRFHDQVQSHTKSRDIDPFMILSLIRQESAFNIRAHSPAGARGLMQVMPATARSIASVRSHRLFDPETNIRVGTKYFTHRLSQYNNDVELTLAAYNAGAGRVDRWVKRYPLSNKMLFMDLVPFRETRDYISSILRNYYWYSMLYKVQNDTSVAAILNANAGASAVRPASLHE